ncbi:MAG: U32 family peptidase, partial [Bdellovibrionaceae bacterium]|nr:U32 family peptidase [Pseudobdellovibrionaceae bacterium]
MNPNNFELLLPVGHKEMALAAIHNGADAIFVGFPGFNARGRSYDHELTELQEIIETCHLYGVKVNLAFNIVIFENELDQVVEAIKKVLPLKPDALIVQDLGLVSLIRQIAPNQVIHGSTQMTVTNDLAIELLSDLNIKRFVLGRENSLSEIKLIKKSTEKELEVFVHGALCVSYSGQCFTSESIGGRSANRGQCAQSCRFSYDLIVDGEKKNTVDRDYLVSPQDLCGIAEIPELMEIGVNSFKVEGRLKSPEYVASVASSYKDVMNKTLDNKKYTDT